MKEKMKIGRPKDHNDFPERDLIDLASEGVPFHTGSDKASIDNIVKCLKDRRPEIFFSFYWTHSDVIVLKENVIPYISSEDVIWYLITLYKLIEERFPNKLHWIERCNLYHVFGMLRLLAKNSDNKANIKKLLKLQSIPNMLAIKPKSVIDVSSISTRAFLEERETKDMKVFLYNFMNSPEILRFYGSYQIYYYGGFENCLKSLTEYARSENQIFIPQSILSILSINKDIKWRTHLNIKKEVKSKLFDVLSEESKKIIEPAIKCI